ncbi:hypothetical protein ACJA28_02330 [Mesomycoplasma moatsii]|uniref:hypothetical protein n=1 Tax=Mesomycoplasma moatsii TaxID=171287 RepID=UPI0003B490CF
MSKNYYELLIEEIESLINQNKEEEAFKKIDEELNLPYVPKIYEEKLKKYLHNLNLSKKSKNIKKVYFSREELLTIMSEYKKHDINFLLDICNEFEQYNWINFEKEIENIFNTDIDSKVKSIIYNTLVVQNLDHDFKLKNITINPVKNKTIFETQFAIKNLIKLSHKHFDDPSIFDICEKIFFIYLMNKFPESLFFEHIDITNELINIANVMLGIKKTKDLNQKEISIYQTISGKQ